MKRNHLAILIAVGFVVAQCTSCTKKLDLKPTNDITAQDVYSTPAGYKQSLAKIYGAFALTGNQGGTGSPDIPTQIISDEGNSDFLRMYWNLQELTTDEAAWSWQNDAGIQGLHEMSWSSINPIIDGLYYRSFFQITLANDFIRQASDDNLKSKGFASTDVSDIQKYREEARFLRAYQYWVLMDLFANVPFVTEKDVIGTTIPKQINRSDLFNYIESELKAIETDLVPARQNEYGRADQAAAWALLARMYLNAEVYTGSARYTDAITYCNKIIGAGYSLHPDYTQLMLADNNLNTDEFIFTINYDGTHTQNWGGTTYLVHGPAGVPGKISGSSGTWSGLRITQNFIALFPDYSGNTDHRAEFYTAGQNLIMNDLYTSTDGFSTIKFRNVKRDGSPAPNADPAGNWSDVDFPLFRLGEIYLIYAESVLRGGAGGDAGTALNYINLLRTRAYAGDLSGNITSADLTTDFILDERGRELYYEAARRTDLIRFNKFTTADYLWAWKGGVKSGTSAADKYNIYPLPTTDLSSNPNLVQNTGY
ncbi:MAG TPA: RagB/SusD family nutrient uptake outer membrane protein [Puia sp.]|nr:RagB/SusD family nutrient uptake outer membrane protein [Puia sp.]